MAFFSKVGNILRQSATKHINPEFSASSPSIYQAIRCMSSKLFIGGLSYSTDDQSLREAFGKYGEVIEARVIMDRETGRSRGFGFITFAVSEEASSAIQALDGQDLHGRRVRVNYATDRVRGGGYGGGGDYGGGNYSGGGGNYGGGGGNYGGGGGNYGGGGGNYGGGDGNYGGGGGNYGGGGGNYGSSGGYTGRGSYGGGGGAAAGGGSYSGNYASGGGSGSYGGNSFDSGSGPFGTGGGNFGVANPSGSNDNYVSDSTGGGFGGADQFDSTGGGFGGAEQFDSTGSNGVGDIAAGSSNHSDPLEANLRDEDDDEPDNFAKRV